MKRFLLGLCASFVAFLCTPAQAITVTEVNNEAVFLAQVPTPTTISFTGFADNTFLTNQYAGVGVTFKEGNDYIDTDPAFTKDFKGARGERGMDIRFDTQWNAVAFWFPGALVMQFYQDDTFLAGTRSFGGSGRGFFAGAITDTSFNRVLIFEGDDAVNIDELIFGNSAIATVPVPAPFLLMIVALGALGVGSRHTHKRA